MQNKGDFPGELIEFDLLKKIVDRIVTQRLINGRQNWVLNFVLHGGEVLLLGKKRLYEILEYITTTFKANGIAYSLGSQTNATLLTEEIAMILSKFEVSVGLSFDGIDGGNTSRTDIKQTVFENKFQILKDSRVNYGFLLVANKTNVDNLDRTKEYLENLGLNVAPEGATEGVPIIQGYKINYAEDMLTPGPESEIEITGQEMFDKVWKPELENFLKRGKTIEFHTKEMLAKSLIDILTVHLTEQKSGCGTKWCGAGLGMIAVEPDGEMDYCDRYSKKFDDVHMMHALDYDFLGINQLNRMTHYNEMKAELYTRYECDTCIADYICDHGCESFYRSKFGDYGIDTRIICDQHIGFYQYVLANLERFLAVYATSGIRISTSDTLLEVKTSMLANTNWIVAISDDRKHLSVTRRVP
jgi:radical SAM protein with 4Fe4S-binding SPASM domain